MTPVLELDHTDAMVAGIRDIDVSGAIEGDAVGLKSSAPVAGPLSPLKQRPCESVMAQLPLPATVVMTPPGSPCECVRSWCRRCRDCWSYRGPRRWAEKSSALVAWPPSPLKQLPYASWMAQLSVAGDGGDDAGVEIELADAAV